jgi:double-stranded uracil-DNA glycosylase
VALALQLGRIGRVRNRTLPTPWNPTKAQLLAARRKRVPDLIAEDLMVLFAGINPGLYTAAIGRHFGRPGNRFWAALHGGGFTPRLFSPFENALLIDLGLGITNVVERATARAGLQKDRFGGRHAWVLPNPSGLNAHYQPADLARHFCDLRLWAAAAHALRR